MNKKHLIRRIVPVSVLVLALVAVGAGAAAGTILAGKVTGEVPVAVSQALLVGQPLDTPTYNLVDEAREDVDGTTQDAYTAIGAAVIADLSGLTVSDNVYDTVGGVAGDRPEQAYKFYVGAADNFSQLVFTWEGKSTLAQGDALRVSTDSGATWTILGGAGTNDDIGLTDTTTTLTFTTSTVPTVAQIVDSSGYVYFNASINDPDETLSTDFVAVTLSDDDMPQQVEDNVTMIDASNRFVGVKSDDNTAFQAAMELAVGDWMQIELPLKNASANNLVARLTLDIPAGLEVEVWANNATASQVTNVVREGLNTWKLIVEGPAEYDTGNDSLYIVVSVDDDAPPGYYSISGIIKQIAY